MEEGVVVSCDRRFESFSSATVHTVLDPIDNRDFVIMMFITIFAGDSHAPIAGARAGGLPVSLCHGRLR